MAKVTTPSAPAAAPAALAVPGARILSGISLSSVSTRAIGTRGGLTDDYRKLLEVLDLPEGASESTNPIFIPVDVPEGTKPDEIEKVRKEEARKVSNRFTNASHGLDGKEFVFRSFEHDGVFGVGAWRVPVGTKPKREKKA